LKNADETLIFLLKVCEAALQDRTREEVMAQLEVFEGTWEELAVHAAAFQGRTLRLIVLPSSTEAADTLLDEAALRERAVWLFGEADNIERASGKPSNAPHAAVFGQMIAEKYRKMGLKL
jgi:hypothetical protein